MYYTGPIITFTTVIIIIFVIFTLRWSPRHLASRGWSCRDAGQQGTNPGHPGKSGMGGNPRCRCLQRKGNFWGCQLKSIVKQRFWGWVTWWAVQKTGEPIWMIYTLYDVFLCKELPFGGHGDCSYVKIFSSVNFLNHSSLTRSLTC